MATSAVQEIETRFTRLPRKTQSSLLGRLGRQVRASGTRRSDAWAAKLSEMAADPDVQREIGRINKEFTAAEADGLGTS